MKEDYLWNKTGEDAEIEKLENSLIMFRYQETNAPILPSKNLVLGEKSPNFFLAFFHSRFAFATLACLGLFVFLAINVWLQFTEITPNDVVVTEIKSSNKSSSQNIQLNNSVIKLPENVAPKFVAEKINVKKSSIAPLKKVQFIARQTKPIVRKDNKVDPAKVLTKEELYAYNQLMTALAITSSKLKLVQNKAQSIEN